MSNHTINRRGLLKGGAVLGAGLAAPTFFTRHAWGAAFTNAPTGATVTFGFNVPQTGAYSEEGADELRAYKLAVQHINGEGDGGMLNTGFLDYRMPTMLGAPNVETIMVEVPHPDHPYGVRGVGEVPIIPPLGALHNAIHRAIGVRMRSLPMSPPKVVQAISESRKVAEPAAAPA